MLEQRSITCIVYCFSWPVLLHHLQKCKPYSAEHLSEHWSHQSFLHTAYDAVHENTDVLKVVAQDGKTIQKPLSPLSVCPSGVPDRGLLRCFASSQPFNKLKETTSKEKRKGCLLHTRLVTIYFNFISSQAGVRQRTQRMVQRFSRLVSLLHLPHFPRLAGHVKPLWRHVHYLQIGSIATYLEVRVLIGRQQHPTFTTSP